MVALGTEAAAEATGAHGHRVTPAACHPESQHGAACRTAPWGLGFGTGLRLPSLSVSAAALHVGILSVPGHVPAPRVPSPRGGGRLTFARSLGTWGSVLAVGPGPRAPRGSAGRLGPGLPLQAVGRGGGVGRGSGCLRLVSACRPGARRVRPALRRAAGHPAGWHRPPAHQHQGHLLQGHPVRRQVGWCVWHRPPMTARGFSVAWRVPHLGVLPCLRTGQDPGAVPCPGVGWPVSALPWGTWCKVERRWRCCGVASPSAQTSQCVQTGKSLCPVRGDRRTAVEGGLRARGRLVGSSRGSVVHVSCPLRRHCHSRHTQAHTYT